MEGWVSLHRKILDNPVVCKDSDHVAIWIYLLLNATHSERKMMFGGRSIILKPGQLITSRKSISSKFNISESKVQRVLKMLEIEQQIEQQTNSKHRLVTIVNWGLYQDTDKKNNKSEQQDEQQLNNNRTTTEQQLNTNNNGINGFNVNNANKKNTIPPKSEWVRDYCEDRNNGITADEFINFYDSNGWMIGKTKMKNWQASIRTWENNRKVVIKENKAIENNVLYDKYAEQELKTKGPLDLGPKAWNGEYQ